MRCFSLFRLSCQQIWMLSRFHDYGYRRDLEAVCPEWLRRWSTTILCPRVLDAACEAKKPSITAALSSASVVAPQEAEQGCVIMVPNVGLEKQCSMLWARRIPFKRSALSCPGRVGLRGAWCPTREECRLVLIYCFRGSRNKPQMCQDCYVGCTRLHLKSGYDC